MQASELGEHVGAAEELARRDPDLARAIAAVGPLNIRPALDSRFAALCRSIVFQQLAGRAAAAIYGRFVQAVGPELTAEAVLAAPQPALRGEVYRPWRSVAAWYCWRMADVVLPAS